MKKFLLPLLILLPLILFAQEGNNPSNLNNEPKTQNTLPQSQNGKPNVYVFTSPTCGHCLQFKREFYPKLKKEFKDKVNFIEIDTSDGKGNIQLREIALKYDLERYGVPCLVAGDHCLIGYPNEIKDFSEKAIQEAIDENITTQSIGEVDSKTAFKNFTFTAIIINGLIDGINPCAFAVIVFLVSFLTIYRYDKKEVILIGSAYCLAVFITYILLGLGLFKALYDSQPMYLLGFSVK